jgi:DNA-binding XRE family transcriptional regulator
MKTKNKNITDFEDFLTEEYGKKGTEKRNEFEREFTAFRLGVLIREARRKANLTQAELAERADTKRSYISRIENDSSDIRLSTLLKIIEQGLGGRLELNIRF